MRPIEDLEADLAAWNSLRPEVQKFAMAMEAKLRANEHKGGWHDDQPEELLLRAYEELGELHREVVGKRKDTKHSDILERRKRILAEGADVANMVLMVVDNCGALK